MDKRMVEHRYGCAYGWWDNTKRESISRRFRTRTVFHLKIAIRWIKIENASRRMCLPVWTRSCFTFSCGRANSLRQYWHAYGNLTLFISAFVLIWKSRNLHEIGTAHFHFGTQSILTMRLFWCALMCMFMLASFGNNLLHILQLNFSSPLCIWTCISSNAFKYNFSQMLQ